MSRKFNTTVLDTLLKTVEVEFKVPLLGFGKIKFPVSEYAKEWPKTGRYKPVSQFPSHVPSEGFVLRHR